MRIRQAQTKTAKPLLYRVVFDAVLVKYLIASFFIFFLLHPTLPVFASESQPEELADESEAPLPAPASDTSDVPEEIDLDETPTQIPLNVPNVGTEEVNDDSEEDTTDEVISLVDETTTVSESEVVDQTEDPNTLDLNGTTSPASSNENLPENTSSSTTPTFGEEDLSLPNSTTTGTTTASNDLEIENPVTDEVPPLPAIDDDIEDSSDDQPEEINPTVEKIVYVPMEVTSDSNRHVFSTNECVGVGNGAFYCYQATEEAGVIGDDGAYAAPDADGDFEIFLSYEGTTQQLTHNTYDDRAPYYDATAEEVVFHRLVDGRYQIFSYNVATKNETQLSHTDANSMEPTQSDGVTVWQEWVGNNWEIAALINSEIVMLSHSEHNDVAPSVKDGYVMWHTLSASGEKLLSVYEISTGITSHIADPDGGQVSNPRFVLVYDTTFENGDTVTKTYDPETGAIEPISNKPWQDKQRIPDPEPAGETSAMINTKPATRDGGREDGDITNAGPEPVSGDDLATTSTTTAGTVASSSASTPQDINLSATTTEPFSLSEFDLVVTPFATASSAQPNNSASTSDSVE